MAHDSYYITNSTHHVALLQSTHASWISIKLCSYKHNSEISQLIPDCASILSAIEEEEALVSSLLHTTQLRTENYLVMVKLGVDLNVIVWPNMFMLITVASS